MSEYTSRGGRLRENPTVVTAQPIRSSYERGPNTQIPDNTRVRPATRTAESIPPATADSKPSAPRKKRRARVVGGVVALAGFGAAFGVASGKLDISGNNEYGAQGALPSFTTTLDVDKNGNGLKPNPGAILGEKSDEDNKSAKPKTREASSSSANESKGNTRSASTTSNRATSVGSTATNREVATKDSDEKTRTTTTSRPKSESTKPADQTPAPTAAAANTATGGAMPASSQAAPAENQTGADIYCNIYNSCPAPGQQSDPNSADCIDMAPGDLEARKAYAQMGAC